MPDDREPLKWECGRCAQRFPTQREAQAHADACTGSIITTHDTTD